RPPPHLGRDRPGFPVQLAYWPGRRPATVGGPLARPLPAPAGFVVRSVLHQLPQFAVRLHAYRVRAGNGRADPRADCLTGPAHAAGAAADGRGRLRTHGRDVSVPGVAGEPDG